MKQKVCRFEIQDLLPIGMVLVVAGIGITYGMNVVGDIKSDECDGVRQHFYKGACFECPNATQGNFHGGLTNGNICSNTSTPAGAGVDAINISAVVSGNPSVNASGNAIKGIAKIPEKMPIIATVIIASVIISILVRYLYVRYSQ